jgi:molybdopterin synthase catalytic subunit
MSRVAIVDRPIDPGQLLAAVSDHSRGGAVLFVGSVRELNDGRPVTALDYRAYDAMARAELGRIVDEALGRWPGAAIAVEHRTGALQLGDLAVVVAAAHAHRSEAFDACRYVIEQLKQRVPIWKREHYADGPAEWVEVTT